MLAVHLGNNHIRNEKQIYANAFPEIYRCEDVTNTLKSVVFLEISIKSLINFNLPTRIHNK